MVPALYNDEEKEQVIGQVCEHEHGISCLVVIFKGQRAESSLPLVTSESTTAQILFIWPDKNKKLLFVYHLSLAVTCEVQFIDCLKLLFSFVAQLAELFI